MSLQLVIFLLMFQTDSLEEMHKAGYLHLDVKHDNILIGSNNYLKPEFRRFYLIDYGLSTSYLTSGK
jgi:serine/threonine protein kinase